MAEYLDTSLGWNDTITQDSRDPMVTKEGDYEFRVAELTRGNYEGSDKLPPCPKATLRLDVATEDGDATVFITLYLAKSMEWKLSAFFRAIGMKKEGEEIIMDWQHVVGKTGKAHFKPTTYSGQDGTKRQAVDLTKFYDYDSKEMDHWNNISDENNPFN